MRSWLDTLSSSNRLQVSRELVRLGHLLDEMSEKQSELQLRAANGLYVNIDHLEYLPGCTAVAHLLYAVRHRGKTPEEAGFEALDVAREAAKLWNSRHSDVSLQCPETVADQRIRDCITRLRSASESTWG